MVSSVRTRVIAVTSVAVTLGMLLGGCSAARHGSSATASAAPTARAVGTPVRFGCDSLVPADVLTVYRKRFRLDPHARPDAGTPGATIAGQRGQVCVWKDPSGITITVAIAHLPADVLTRLKNSLYEHSNPVPTYTVEGYFDRLGRIGRADSFPDPYWVDAESTIFGEPGDAQPIMDSVRSVIAPNAPSVAPTTGHTVLTPTPSPTAG